MTTMSKDQLIFEEAMKQRESIASAMGEEPLNTIEYAFAAGGKYRDAVLKTLDAADRE